MNLLLDFLSRNFRTLALWQWLVLLVIPPLIVLLYFLKLKRQPLEVPSTYLWHKTIEDLHVNSFWQRLRQNLLLFLQLLLLLLAMLALLRPSWQGTQLTEDRYIFLVDTSASMSATDVNPTRLDAVKERLVQIVDNQLKPGSVVLLISFSDRAVVEQPFTDNRRLLRRKIRGIEPTQKRSDVEEALRVAAGLANPGRSAADDTDVAAAEALPATLMIFSDGRFVRPPSMAMGNLKPVYAQFGKDDSQNLGIVAFNVAQNQAKPDQIQAFAQIQNFHATSRQVTANLYLIGEQRTLLDAAAVRVPGEGTGGVEFVLDEVPSGALELEIEQADDLLLDNRAFAVINPPRRAEVLLISPKNDALETVLSIPQIQKLARVQRAKPSILESAEYQSQTEEGTYDLIIYDQVTPKTMPRSNTYFIGSMPPTDAWRADEMQSFPQIIDADRRHPLMQFVELGDVKYIVEATPLNPPSGAKVLIDSQLGPLMAISPRAGYEDLVQAFEIVGQTADGQSYANTDWPIRTSFPVFIGNVLTYLGGFAMENNTSTVRPGASIALRVDQPVPEVVVETPAGRRETLQLGPQNTFLFGGTDQLGIYQVYPDGQSEVSQRFSVNLFDAVESNIRPTKVVETSYEQIGPPETTLETTRFEAWKWLLIIALIVLIVEWYIYNRRVYV